MRKIKASICLIAIACSLLTNSVMANEEVTSTETAMEKQIDISVTTTEKSQTIESSPSKEETKLNQKKSEKNIRKKKGKNGKSNIAEKKETEEKKKKEEKKIPMPKRTVKVKGCRSINKRIQKLKKEKIDLQNKIQKEQKKKKALENFYSNLDTTYGVEIALLGQKIQTKRTKEDIAFQQRLIELSKTFDDPYLKEISKKFVFGLRMDYEINLPLEKKETFNLNDYLQKKHISSIDSMKRRIDKINKSIKLEKKVRYFDPKNVSYISNITVSDAQQMLSGTELYSEAESFVKAERLYNVNAVFLMAIAAHESAWGTSRRAKEDNNLTGYGVYSDNATGINKKTKEENLLATAATLHDQYLTEGGNCYEGGKSVANVNKNYCVGNEWAGAVVNYGYQLMKKLQ